MSRADYDHWNEEADRVWWQEEGRHADEPRDPDDDDYVAFLRDGRVDDEYGDEADA